MPAAGLLDLYSEAWFWGMRCENKLYMVGQYIKCNKGEKAACQNIEKIRDAALNAQLSRPINSAQTQ